MAIDFNSLLSAEQKREILQGRLQQFASEAYQITLNKKTATEIGTRDQLDKIEESLVLLEKAIAIHEKELAEL
jgi:hypothetical protein